MNIKIVSGGQTGVDQGALEAAAQLGMSSALVLNVAGPRESKSPGIQAKTTVSYEVRRLPKL